MKNKQSASILALVIAAAALLVAVIALVMAHGARETARSDVTVEEGETLNLPLYDEEQDRFSYLILAELQITNQGAAAVKILELGRHDADAGFLMALKDEEVQSGDFQAQLYPLQHTFAEIQAQPRLLKEILKHQPGGHLSLNHVLQTGQSKTFRYAVHLTPYDADKRALADMVLISLRLTFDNGKTRVMRQGYPVQPLLP